MWIIVRWLALGTTTAALACGGSEQSPPATVGQGGNAGSAGSTAAGTSAGGGPAAGAAGSSTSGGNAGSMSAGSAAEACNAYAVAVCTRQAECLQTSSDHCYAAGQSCPDLTFSPGSTRTVEDLNECAELYETMPCEQVNAGVLPACVTPGERTRGEPCSFSSQCSSLTCVSTGECGVCGVEVAVGESCALPDVDCPTNAYCGSNFTCESYLSSEPLPGENEPCAPNDRCAEGLFCFLLSEPPLCAPRAQPNEPCSGTYACTADAYCSPELVCTALPGEGQPCGLSDGQLTQSRAMYCQAGLTCHYSGDSAASGTCLPPPGVGEPCAFPPDLQTPKICAEGLHCNITAVPMLCAAAGKPGEACTHFDQCEAGNLCECPPETPDCTLRVCMNLRYAGQRCDEPNTMCHPAFDCAAGVCRAGELRGIFAEECGP